jgi:UDPglucose 6-dehydrogenase
VLGHVAGVSFVETQAAALIESDALLIVTEWRQFKSPDFEQIRDTLKQPVVFDGRNLYDPTLMKEFGIEYRGIGRAAHDRTE